MLLVLLDLSAAFDTIDHTKLVDRLEMTFGIGGTALESYIRDIGRIIDNSNVSIVYADDTQLSENYSFSELISPTWNPLSMMGRGG